MKNKQIIAKTLIFISILLTSYFFMTLIIDYKYYYEYGSAPFYVYILSAAIQMLIPAIICLVIGIILIKKAKNS